MDKLYRRDFRYNGKDYHTREEMMSAYEKDLRKLKKEIEEAEIRELTLRNLKTESKKTPKWIHNGFKLLIIPIFLLVMAALINWFYIMPRIRGDLIGLSIVKDLSNKWSVVANIHLENRGRTKTTVQITKINILIPSVNKSSFVLPVDESFRIDGLDQIDDTISSYFPNEFKDTDEFELLSVNIHYKVLSLKKEKIIYKDSADIEMTTISKSDWVNNSSLFRNSNMLNIDENGIPADQYGTYKLFYKGKAHTIKYFPLNFPIGHSIKGDSILFFAEYESDKDSTRFNTITSGLIIKAHKNIGNKCFIKNNGDYDIFTVRKNDDNEILNKFKMKMREEILYGITFYFKPD